MTSKGFHMIARSLSLHCGLPMKAEACSGSMIWATSIGTSWWRFRPRYLAPLPFVMGERSSYWDETVLRLSHCTLRGRPVANALHTCNQRLTVSLQGAAVVAMKQHLSLEDPSFQHLAANLKPHTLSRAQAEPRK